MHMSDSTLHLTVESTGALSAARRELRELLVAEGCGNIDDAVLVFSELVTNALMHGGGAPSVVVVHGDHELNLDVEDRAAAAPFVRQQLDARHGGRGMHIVERASERWGWEPTPTGKRVWASIPCCPT